MICIYHNADIDGFMSAAIVKLKYPDVYLRGWNYYDPIPDEVWIMGDIIMVDVSFPPEVMLQLQQSGNDFIWIDHHISSISKNVSFNVEKGGNYPMDIEGIRNIDYAACELTWKYFFENKPMPELVRQLGRYDCWGHVGTNEEEAIFQFQYGARSYIHNVKEAYAFLKDSLNNENSELETLALFHQAGFYIYRYLCEDAKWAYEHRHDVVFDISNMDKPLKAKFAFIGKAGLNPKAMQIHFEKDGYTGAASYNINVNGMVKVTLYSDIVNCAMIANSFGGGGHEGAAGFTIPLSDFQKLLNIDSNNK